MEPDTGNEISIFDPSNLPHFARPPYGISYFHKPGRFSNGRIIIDFLAEYFGLPYLEPYFLSKDYSYGANFAIGGATAMDAKFFEERGDVYNWETWGSLDTQMKFCRTMLASLSPKAANDLLSNSLIVIEIGGNDYNHFLLNGGSYVEAKSFMRPVVNKIGSVIVELIELGAVSFLVLGNLPIGCLSVDLEYFYRISNKEDFDPTTGCITWLNDFIYEHDTMLQAEVSRIQLLYPHTTITFGDLYNATTPIFHDPKKYGIATTLEACCGGGGKYNYNGTLLCGDSALSMCEDPNNHVNWDGYHFTEAANRIGTNNLLESLKTVLQFQHSCASKSSV